MTRFGGIQSGADVLAAYKQLLHSSGNGTAAAVAGTKYFMMGGQANLSAPNPQTNAAINFPFLLRLLASDLAAVGTTKLRVGAVALTGTAPAVDIAVGLYPVTGGATQSLGTVVTGSVATIARPSANSDTPVVSGDFDLPADGLYALGYTVSATPAAGFAIQARLAYHHV